LIAAGRFAYAPVDQARIERPVLERDEKKWKPVFRRNQVYADCINLAAISSSILLESIAFHDFGPIQSKIILI
jgi:hypothetical protein